MTIPAFNAQGNLPKGIHTAEWLEFSIRFGKTARRRELLTGLEAALRALQDAGCALVYIDGSFVTSKEEPADFDVCWSVRRVILELLDPALLAFEPGQAAQKAKYGGELFPADLPQGADGQTFLEFFQADKDTGAAKGIVAIDLDSQDLAELTGEDEL